MSQLLDATLLVDLLLALVLGSEARSCYHLIGLLPWHLNHSNLDCDKDGGADDNSSTRTNENLFCLGSIKLSYLILKFDINLRSLTALKQTQTTQSRSNQR